MAYPTSELITTATVKAINNITVADYDTFIGTLIPYVCRSIESYCRRRFAKYTWLQWYAPNRELMLDEWPINNILLLGVPYRACILTDTSNNLTFNITQANSRNLNIASKLSVIDASALTSTDYSFGTYTTLGALKTAVEAAHATVTMSYESQPSTVTFANINTLTLRPGTGKTFYFGANYFDQADGTLVDDIYRISDNSDRLLLNNCWFDSIYWPDYGIYTGYPPNIDIQSDVSHQILVVSDCGYAQADVPSELTWVIGAIINDVMAVYDVMGSGKYIGIYQSETLGDYTYRLWDASKTGSGGTGAVINDLINTKYADSLDIFKKKVI